MESLEHLKKVVLEKAIKEAENRIDIAKEEARRIVEEAEKVRRSKIESEKRKIEEELNYDAKIAEAKLSARLIIHDVKNRIVKEIEKRVIDFLKGLDSESRWRSLVKLLDESLQYILYSYGNIDQITLKISESDIDLIDNLKNYVESRYGIKITSIIPVKILGGIIIEIAGGTISIDNSYDSRLSIILKNRLPSLVKEIFQ